MQLPTLLDRIASSGRLAKAVIGIVGAGVLLASGASVWFLLVFRGFVVSVRASYEPIPFFLQLPTFAALLLIIGLLALASVFLIIASFKRAPPNNSFKPNPLRGSA